jgi:glycosyltransferase involved in cell wall biosynthesis
LKIVCLTARAPFGPHEAFFVSEIVECIRQGHELVLIPRAVSDPIMHEEAEGLEKISLAAPLLSGKIVAAALGETLRHPLRVCRALGLILNPRGIGTWGANLLLFPKGLWIGRMARQAQAEHIHAQWSTTVATMAMTAGEVSGIPWSFTAHRGDIAANNLLATKVARASFVRYISQSGCAMAESLGVRHPPGKIAVIHMGVKIPATPVVRPAPRQTPLILCPAALFAVKGHQYLLQAMALLKDRGAECCLHIAGEGDQQGALRKLAAELSLGEVVQFLGHRLNEELLQWYRQGAVDVMVLPSVDLGHHVHEGIPVSLMEAMAYGVPVVSTTTGGIAELLHDGAGLMVPPQDPAALAEALERLIRSPELRRQLGDAGRRRVAEEFNLERVVAQLNTRIRAAGAKKQAP